MKRTVVGLSVFLVIGVSGVCMAQEMKAVKRFSDATVAFNMQGGYSKYTLTVTGPNGFNATVFSEKSVPALTLRKLGVMDDGIYRYTLAAASSKTAPVRAPANSGRSGKVQANQMVGVSDSGSFVVKGGKIVQDADISE